MLEFQAFEQDHLIQDFEKLSEEQKEKVQKQFQSLDWLEFLEQKRLFALKEQAQFFPPLESCEHSGDENHIQRGQKIVQQNKVACVLLAGGQGTRLKVQVPKGTLEISLVKKKSLFQIFCEKIMALQKKLGCSLLLAIMTSPLNHEQVIRFFERHQFFGLEVHFFQQSLFPFLNQEGKWFWDDRGNLAMGPSGNGDFFKSFVSSSAFDLFKKKNIEHITTIQVENPLANPFDFELIGFHDDHDNQVTIKCIQDEKEEATSGILVMKDEKLLIQEYFLFKEDSLKERKQKYLSIGNFCLSMNFIEEIARENKKIPMHLPQKKHQDQNVFKSERFIFDAFCYADRIKALCFEEKNCYAPLKNMSQLEQVQKKLYDRDCEIIYQITGKKIERYPLELSMEFHFPTPELIQRWKGRLPQGEYIEPLE